MKIGSTTITNCKIGNVQVKEVRIGSTLVWSGFDADAQLFITNAVITDATQQNAVNNLVVALKGYGIWTKMKALYPFVGGTASQHKFNLKNPLDTDAAFRLVFNGGWTHSNTGALPNGTNAYANTFFNPNIQLSNFNIHLSSYCRSQITTNAGCELGATDSGFTNQYALYQYLSSVSRKLYVAGSYPTYSILINNTNTLGFQIGNRTANNAAKLYFNNSILGTNTSVFSGTLPNRNIPIGAINAANSITEFSNKQTAFNSIGDGLTDTEAANFYTAVQAFQTTLSRNV